MYLLCWVLPVVLSMLFIAPYGCVVLLLCLCVILLGCDGIVIVV